jgi:hypothetical protein
MIAEVVETTTKACKPVVLSFASLITTANGSHDMKLKLGKREVSIA